MLRTADSGALDSLDVGSKPATWNVEPAACRHDGCTKGACIAGIVLQQFLP